MSKLVYLAGPILGCSFEGCTDWRLEAAAQLGAHGVEALDPMRAKGFLRSHLAMNTENAEHALTTAKAITARDRFDVARCDLVLMNLLGATQVSIGSMIEAGWADVGRKPVVLVMEPGNIHDHGMVREIAGFRAHTLEEGLAIVLAVLQS